MAEVLIGVGSNYRRKQSLDYAVDELRQIALETACSSRFDTAPTEGVGRRYLNMVILLRVDLTLVQLLAETKRIEREKGRSQCSEQEPRSTCCPLDIDILSWDDLVGRYAGLELPRPELLRHAYILAPLAELVPDRRHPATGLTYREHWHAFRASPLSGPSGIR